MEYVILYLGMMGEMFIVYDGIQYGVGRLVSEPGHYGEGEHDVLHGGAGCILPVGGQLGAMSDRTWGIRGIDRVVLEITGTMIKPIKSIFIVM